MDEFLFVGRDVRADAMLREELGQVSMSAGFENRQVAAVDHVSTQSTGLANHQPKIRIHFRGTTGKIQRFNTFLLYKIEHICDCFCSHNLFASRSCIDMTMLTGLVAQVTKVYLQYFQLPTLHGRKVSVFQ